MELKIGSHVSLSGDKMYLGSVQEALSYQATAFMIYTGAPQNTIRKPIESLNIAQALDLMQAHHLSVENVVVHAPYIINLANPDPEKRSFAIGFLTQEVKRTEALQVTQIVLHPGSAVGLDRTQAISWIAEGVNEVIRRTPNSKVRIALETMAGKGNEVGKTFEELKQIIDLVEEKNRVSVCFDTCHTHDAGYDVKDHFDEVIKQFDQIVGIKKISVIHVNDSKNDINAHKDRHENIGFGYIGFDTLNKIVHDKRFENIPKILETPYVEGKPPYYHEIKMFRDGVFNPHLIDVIKNDD